MRSLHQLVAGICDGGVILDVVSPLISPGRSYFKKAPKAASPTPSSQRSTRSARSADQSAASLDQSAAEEGTGAANQKAPGRSTRTRAADKATEEPTDNG